MRLAIIGGGGFRVPLVYRALLDEATAPGGRRPVVDEVALYDTDQRRLAAIAGVLAGLAADRSNPPRVQICAELDQALTGAEFVFCAIRVGGLAGRIVDERVALDLGLVGQETTGAGGVCYGLRSVPAMVHIAERIAAVAPAAWTINFTNPAGMVTEAMAAVLGQRVLGICDSPVGLCRRVAWLLDVRPDRVFFDYAGLNHLGWLRAAYVDGVDQLPRLLGDAAALARIEEGRLFGPDLLRRLAMIPNEYLYYYYFSREAIESVRAQGRTRGEFLAIQQGDFYARLAAGGGSAGSLALDPRAAAAEWIRVRAEREATYLPEARRGPAPVGEPPGGGYEQVALAALAALAGQRWVVLVLNTANRGALPDLDSTAVVELPCLVDATGVHPLPTGGLPDHATDLVTAVKAVERATIEAARTGCRAAALRALTLHPLVDSAGSAQRLLDGYAAGHPELARFTAD